MYHINIPANGPLSIVYDIFSCMHALFLGYKKILVLGVSGAPVLIIFKLFPTVRTFTNIDGIEWRRKKWSILASKYLRLAEFIAVKFSDYVIADNDIISNYVRETYNINSHTIAYGGDTFKNPIVLKNMGFALSICRIEPENNIHIILKSFSTTGYKLFFIGNWDSSNYGRKLKEHYNNKSQISCIDPIYDQDKIQVLRSECSLYIHGHSAGGTNPSLVEMMFYGKDIIAYDCSFNRVTLGGHGSFFRNPSELSSFVNDHKVDNHNQSMIEYAHSNYTWKLIRRKYYKLLRI